MYKCSPQEVIQEVPDVQSVMLPRDWFDGLDENKSVFTSLYEWMLNNSLIPSKNEKTLHNRTYVGEKLFKKLLSAERKRLRKKLKIKGDELERTIRWSNINSGPKTEVGSCKISGDLILVIPESSRQALGEFSTKVFRKQNDKLINKIKVNAAGATFYQWLLPQVDRPDCIGDIARSVVNWDKFPRESIYYEEIKSYLISIRRYKTVIESMKESWMEYIQKYSERVQPSAWCSECGDKIDVENASFVCSLEFNELYILDGDCLAKYNKYDRMLSRSLSGITKGDIENMVENEDVSKFDVEEMIERLQLWGILPVNLEKFNKTGSNNRKYARRSISNSKRYEVMRRDKFQCVLCGASGSEARLEIDHIIPVSKGGSDDMDNLRCLCFRCNRGKHSKIE